MSSKSETPEASAPAEAGAAKKGGGSSMLPAIMAIVAAPAITWAVCQFVLIPQLKKELGSAAAGEPAHVAETAAEGGHGKEASGHGKAAKGGEAASAASGYTFENIVVNLSGTMGTRYLKTTFLVTGSDGAIKSIFDEKRPALLDVTLNVLSSLSLADLEEAGSKNLIREKLIQSYNQALGRKVAEQIFFSDFVVQ
ncbi:flagellar basal body-associated FliL family protein [Rariglobus hedericola]|uniref:Flagellar protein FliL n=1 Tax=Rariglobus hedericola TaxID=2597822 RepID=A0A556QPT3_9BACT|nr:flagellar basal body-associated FliL family protein [Rariglobus hedericola]TSJ78650.1 flagellar basal body-associated FliL family protein [Rariglobus hedericola]